MIKKISLVILFVLMGFAATTEVYILFLKQHSPVISPLPVSHFSLDKPPSKSLVGYVISLSGQVLWQSRVADTPINITKPQKVQQGEELQTGSTGKLTLEIPKVASMTAFPDTQFSIVQTLPANIVIQENQGAIGYNVLGDMIPISIRSMDILVTIQKGQCSVSVDKDKATISVSVALGSATIAYTDTNDITQIQTILKGQKIILNNNTKEVNDY